MTKTQVRNEYALIQRFMVKDCERGIRDAKANYLVALGLFSYLEVVGGWITGKGAMKGQSPANFNAALCQMNAAYQALDAKIESHDASGKVIDKGLYAIVRCGLVHEYSPKGPVIVINRPKGAPKKSRFGVDVVRDKKGIERIVIYTNELLRDLKILLRTIRSSVNDADNVYYPNVKTVLERMNAYHVAV